MIASVVCILSAHPVDVVVHPRTTQKSPATPLACPLACNPHPPPRSPERAPLRRSFEARPSPPRPH